MRKEIRTVVYDEELRMEAYRFEGIVQPFPSHFHEHYVIGVVESGERVLSCRGREYAIGEGSILLFHPGDSPLKAVFRNAGRRLKRHVPIWNSILPGGFIWTIFAVMWV